MHAPRIEFGDFGGTVSPYPFVLSFPQDDHERLLVAEHRLHEVHELDPEVEHVHALRDDQPQVQRQLQPARAEDQGGQGPEADVAVLGHGGRFVGRERRHRVTAGRKRAKPRLQSQTSTREVCATRG